MYKRYYEYSISWRYTFMISFQSYYLLKWKGGEETLLESWMGAVTPRGLILFPSCLTPPFSKAGLLRQLVPRCWLFRQPFPGFQQARIFNISFKFYEQYIWESIGILQMCSKNGQFYWTERAITTFGFINKFQKS